MSRSVKEQVDRLNAVLLESAENSAIDVSTHRKLLRSLCSLKVLLTNLNSAERRELSAPVRSIVVAIQSYHSKQNGSDCVIQVFCDVLTMAYDGSAVSECMEILLSKIATFNAKLTIARAMAQWTYTQLQSASGYVPELLSLGSKHVKHAEMYVRHTLAASLAKAISTYGPHGTAYHSEAAKLATKFITDKSPEIRSAASEIFASIIQHAEASDNTSLDALFVAMVKSVDDAAPEIRRSMAVNMGKLLSLYVSPSDTAQKTYLATTSTAKKSTKPPGQLPSLDHAILFIKDTFCSPVGVGGAFSSCAIIIATLCEAHSTTDALTEPKFPAIIEALLSFLEIPLPSANEYVRARNALGFALREIAKILNERDQQQWLRSILIHHERPALQYHQQLVLVVECSHLFHALGEATVVYSDSIVATLGGFLSHEKHSLRMESAISLASLAISIPYRRQSIFDVFFTALKQSVELALPSTGTSRADTAALYALQGYCATLTQILRAVKLHGEYGFSIALYNNVLDIGERMLESQYSSDLADPIWLTCTRAGWELIAALLPLHTNFTSSQVPRLCGLWIKATSSQAREPSQELLRLEGAIIALHCYLLTAPTVVDSLGPLFSQILHGTLSPVLAMGIPTKQRAKVAKHRVISWLLKCYSCISSSFVADSWMILLDLIAEFTTAQPLTSLARSNLLPPATTYLPSSDAAATVRLVSGDGPDPMYLKELNLILSLQQSDTAMSDIELETSYLDSYVTQLTGEQVPMTSAFTYVRMVDACVHLFPSIFLAVPEELQLRSLQHFAGVLADPKVGLDCVINVSAMLLATVHEALSQSRRVVKSPYMSATWPLTVQSMLMELLGSNIEPVRRSAAEGLGTLASLLSDSNIRALVQEIETKVTTNLDEPQSPLLAGSALALAQLKRSCGSRCTVDISLLFRLNQDHVFANVQPLRTWGLHAWSLLLECVNTSGDYEELYVTPSLALIEIQFLAGFRFHSSSSRKSSILKTSTSICISIGQVINSIVSALGPELLDAGNRIDELYGFWDLLRMTQDPRIEYEYLRFVEQLVLFAPSSFKACDLQQIKALIRQPSTTAECRAVMLLILRILVERDPSLIHAENLHLILFQALEIHESTKNWTILPLYRGLHPTGHLRLLKGSTSAISELQGCLNALLVTECGVQRLHNGAKACDWLLFCRGIAIGGVSSLPPVDESPRHGAASTSTAADLWRRSIDKIAHELANIPCLHRRVREFAVVCVLAVLDLVEKSPFAGIHFDVGKTRHAVASADKLDRFNYVSLYIDELVTLACQISAISIDGFELQAFQSLGMTLLNVICRHFAKCIDPDIPDETVLVQYQAQLSSTIRRAFAPPDIHDPPQSSPFALRHNVAFEPLLLEGATTIAYVVANRIIVDKVAVNRLIKLLFMPDFTFPLSTCDDVVRFQLAFSVLGSLARLGTVFPDVVDANSFQSHWENAARDYALLHTCAPVGLVDFSGAFFITTRHTEVLKTISSIHTPAFLASLAMLPGSDKTQLLSIALLYLSTKPTDTESLSTLLTTLPSLLEWTSMTLETYDNVLQNLLPHPLTTSSEVVQLAALKALQPLLTKDGAAFVKANNSPATCQLIYLTSTAVLRRALTSSSTVLIEGMRIAVAGVALLSQVNAIISLNGAFVVVANDVIRQLSTVAWFQVNQVSALYFDATLRCAAGATLSEDIGILLSTIESLALQVVSNDNGDFVVSFASLVAKFLVSLTTHTSPEFTTQIQGLHDRVSIVWARQVRDNQQNRAAILAAARPLSAYPWFARRLGSVAISLVHSTPRVLSDNFVEQVEAWLTALLSSMDPIASEKFLHVVLPLLLHLPSQTIVGRMLIGYATSFSASFKGAVAQLNADRRSALEVALRQALVEKQAETNRGSTPSSSMSLDLSRYG